MSLFFYWSIDLSIYLSIYLSIHQSIYLYIIYHLLIWVSSSLSIYLVSWTYQFLSRLFPIYFFTITYTTVPYPRSRQRVKKTMTNLRFSIKLSDFRENSFVSIDNFGWKNAKNILLCLKFNRILALRVEITHNKV